MSTSAKKSDSLNRAVRVEFQDSYLFLKLDDGREIRTLLQLYPALERANKQQRENFRLIGEGTGIHWPDLDEDLSVEGIVLGRNGK